MADRREPQATRSPSDGEIGESGRDRSVPDRIEILILSNGPGEVTTWVRPVVREVRSRWGDRARISVVLSPCPNATGQEAAIAARYPEVDRVQAAQHFWPFFLAGRTRDWATGAAWDWGDRGVVVFLGGDRFFPVVIGRRLGYATVVYGEWDAGWYRWIDRFGVRLPAIAAKTPARYAAKVAVIGDLMAEVAADAPDPAGDRGDGQERPSEPTEWIGLLPGSKAAKLAQGVPLVLAIAQHLRRDRPHLRFVLPVAPTLSLETLAQFAQRDHNPVIDRVGGVTATLTQTAAGQPALLTPDGTCIHLVTEFPAHPWLRRCQLCLTTVGANTAELGALAVPMVVLLPTQQLDAMRAWDGIPGILANLPGVGSLFAQGINRWALRRIGLLAWPNIWAGEAIVPELVGELEPGTVARYVLDLLNDPETLAVMRSRLRAVRGQPGAARQLVDLIGLAAGDRYGPSPGRLSADDQAQTP